MKEIKIFLASSEELKDDRKEFRLFIGEQNDKYVSQGIYFKVIYWENFLDAISQTRLQDEYNKKVASCDIFLSLFKTKVGKYTEEEFDKALETFRATGKPSIYTYFKKATIDTDQINRQDLNSLLDFKEKLKKMEHFYPPYNNIEDLKLRFISQIDKFLPQVLANRKKNPLIKPQIIQKPQKTTPKNLILEVNAFDIEMIYVKGGTFRMGSEDWERTQPICPRRIADFYIGKYPVTVDEYMDFVREMKSNYPEWEEKDSRYNLKQHYEGFTDKYSQPIVGVSWHNAVAYCRWLSKKTGKIFRLLSEAEWEYAAGGGSQNRTKYAGTNNEKDLKDYAWYWKNSGDKKLDGNWSTDKIHRNNCKTHIVGQKKPNQLGIHDMSGNVWEWCQDTMSDNYDDAPTNEEAYEDGDFMRRVLRGGSWVIINKYCQITFRSSNHFTNRISLNGFRIASSLP